MGQPISRALQGRAVARLLAEPRFEILPTSRALEELAVLPPGTVVTVTASPRKGVAGTVELCEHLAARGLRPVPHLAARQLTGRAELGGALDRLAEAGVADLFVVGGDATTPAGEFADGLALLRAIAEHGRVFEHIGVPSYPDGHYLIDDEALWDALAAKQHYATYTVTQMCFDAEAVCRFVWRARQRGITLPIIAGVPGAVDVARLLRVSLRIGVGDSVRFARGNRGVAGRLLRPRGYRPDALIRKLGTRIGQGDCDLAGLHVYTFNQVAATMRWLRTARRRVAS